MGAGSHSSATLVSASSGRSHPWHRDSRVDHGAPARLSVDGNSVAAFEGESLAVALAAAGFLTLRHSPTAGGARGMFCLMGVCQECVVSVDGVPATACVEPVRDGMVVSLSSLRSAGRGS
jgi:predicted molibdopterin-dependent oxidoreductase YjgC